MAENDEKQEIDWSGVIRNRYEQGCEAAGKVLEGLCQTTCRAIGPGALSPAMLGWYLTTLTTELLWSEMEGNPRERREEVARSVRALFDALTAMEETSGIDQRMRAILIDGKDQVSNDLMMRPIFQPGEDLTYDGAVPAPIVV